MNTTMTLAELATTHPAASRVFHRHNLDFCCGGRRPLIEVAREQGLDADRLLQEIATEDADAPDAPTWSTRPLADLIAFIVSHYHARLRTEIPALIQMAATVEDVHADKPTCPRGLSSLLGDVHDAVLEHLAKEEQILFPLIVSGRGRMAGSPINVMEREHDEHGQNLRVIRTLTANLTPPPEACATWRALYVRLDAFEAELMEHIHLENNVLFPRALTA